MCIISLVYVNLHDIRYTVCSHISIDKKNPYIWQRQGTPSKLHHQEEPGVAVQHLQALGDVWMPHRPVTLIEKKGEKRCWISPICGWVILRCRMSTNGRVFFGIQHPFLGNKQPRAGNCKDTAEQKWWWLGDGLWHCFAHITRLWPSFQCQARWNTQRFLCDSNLEFVTALRTSINEMPDMPEINWHGFMKKLPGWWI